MLRLRAMISWSMVKQNTSCGRPVYASFDRIYVNIWSKPSRRKNCIVQVHGMSLASATRSLARNSWITARREWRWLRSLLRTFVI